MSVEFAAGNSPITVQGATGFFGKVVTINYAGFREQRWSLGRFMSLWYEHRDSVLTDLERIKQNRRESYAKTPAYRAGRPRLPDRVFRVWRDFGFACSESGKRAPLDRDLYEWLKVNGREDCTAKRLDFKTWARYLREARKLLGKQKHKPAS
jgi:hypothetical protein